MAPGIHPPCTPTSSCTPQRCHPTPPPCPKPEKCLSRSSKKGSKPCPSAVSILATKSKLKCSDCNKCGGRTNVKKQKKIIQKYLKAKKKESKLMAADRRSGTNRYASYMKKKNKPTARNADPCCLGVGHRGVLNPKKLPRNKNKKSSMSDVRGKKPCVPAPSCAIHKCRPRGTPCPDPGKCYDKTRKSPIKCESAKEIITARGSPCTCSTDQSLYSRKKKKGERVRTNKAVKQRLRKIYRKRSSVSRWEDPNRKKCIIL